MGTFYNRHPAASENNWQTPFPQFPGGFHGVPIAEYFGSHTSQATNLNSNAGIPAIPVRTVAPANGPNCETKPAKGKNIRTPENDTSYCKMSKPKKPKKKSSASKKTKTGVHLGSNIERKNPDLVYDEANVDFSKLPPPFCSCTGVARACYKWGAGSWQSSCCNTTISQYPLPRSPSKPGARIGGRKMSNGAYRKLICRFAAEGRDLSQPVDLKNHWAKLGTNKFVTIK